MITVLVATYNGERYLAEQLDSLLAQTAPDFHILIQDDASSDSTWDIIQRYRRRYPAKISARRLERNTGNAKHNFYSMMASVRDDYLMLCDQDDVWLPDKIEKTYAAMKNLESRYGKGVPLLVHTDLRVVDRRLQVINPSFKRAMNANYAKTRLNQQIIQNTLTGCTCLYNRALAELITGPEPEYMVMHDWWLMLVASAFGRIGSLDEQTILYRQHAANEIGAKDVRTLGYKWNKLLHGDEIREALAGAYRQAESFLRKYRGRLSAGQERLLEQYCDIPNHTKIVRCLTVCRLGILKNGLGRKIAYFIFL